MIKKIDITNPKLAAEVLQVQIPSYKIEAQIIHYDEIPPLKDSIETLQQCGEQFYGYYTKDELSGVISFKIENRVLDINRLFVHPKQFKKGIAQKLLDFIQDSMTGFDKIIVSTGSENLPAIKLYLKNGFIKTKDRQITEHMSLTLFEKIFY